MNTPHSSADKKGTLVISLDFELHWGVFDKVDLKARWDYFLQTRKMIPELLALFRAYDIAVTWATVGMLFAKDKTTWEQYSPRQKPAYKQSKFSAYEWVKANGGPFPEVHFAPDLIEAILKFPKQELASHTFAHFYTSEEGQTAAAFREDLQAAQQIAKDTFGVSLQSLVFPRNQYQSSYLQLCKEEGFQVVRSNPKDWYWKDPHKETLPMRIFRTGDAYFPTGKSKVIEEKTLQQTEDLPLELPASRLLRSYHPRFQLLNTLRLNRIFQEMEVASRTNGLYHLWWHPHNFGYHTAENMRDLEKILHKANSLGMTSKTMGDFVR
jgi:peptidoglycan/xylan/chitin deacetylase (PgdA/CDA1 family)